MTRWIVGLALLGCSAARCPAAEPQGPVQLVVIASEEKKCHAFTRPRQENLDLATSFPHAQLVYKGPTAADESGLLYQSCEITVRKEELLATFSYCALASASDNNSLCSVSFNAEGGRDVEFVAISKGARPATPALCTFVCTRGYPSRPPLP
jgi:hypothetical protein